MRRVDSLEKTLMLGGIGGRRKRGWQRMRWLDGITDLMDVSFSELQEMVMDREAWCAAIYEVAKSWTRLSNWTELNPDINNLQTKQVPSLPFLFKSILSSFSLLNLFRTLEVGVFGPSQCCLVSSLSYVCLCFAFLFAPGKINRKIPGFGVQWAILTLKFMSWVVWNYYSALNPQPPLI